MFRRKRAKGTPPDPGRPTHPEHPDRTERPPNPPPEPGGPEDPLDLRLGEHDEGPMHLTMDTTQSMLDNLLDGERRLGPGHPDVLRLRYNYAFFLCVWSAAAPPGDTYMQDKAIPLFLVNLDHQTATLGPYAGDTLLTLYGIGSAHLSAGRPTEALPYLQRALEGSELDPDRDEQQILDRREKLSDAYAAADDTDRAIALLEETVAGSRRLLAPGTERLDARKQKLFTAYHEAGRPEAEALCREILADKERFYGPDHLSTYIWVDNLAHLLHDARDLDGAIACYERAVSGFEQIHGPDSDATSYRYHNLAIAHLEAGRPEVALPYLKASLAAREHSRGLDDPGTLDALISLISGYDQAGRLTEAIAATERLIADVTRVGGPQHPKLPEVYAYLAELRRVGRDDL
ncbi:tetratricopeptide repeat protein [Streptomyces sp. NPDC046716]|uniref:tetratricopeptide repeat protein n=1 Tax=Streptomyces sp. NPDC046716 TaxID=3157093 RepID=UPI0033D5649E